MRRILIIAAVAALVAVAAVYALGHLVIGLAVEGVHFGPAH